jgi:hypothetical protein
MLWMLMMLMLLPLLLPLLLLKEVLLLVLFLLRYRPTHVASLQLPLSLPSGYPRCSNSYATIAAPATPAT